MPFSSSFAIIATAVMMIPMASWMRSPFLLLGSVAVITAKRKQRFIEREKEREREREQMNGFFSHSCF